MKKFSFVLTVAALLLAPVSHAQVRDERLLWPLAAALETKDARQRLDGTVKFFFGDQPHPAVVKGFGGFGKNLRTHSFNRTPQEACNWVFLSNMLELQKRARQAGANAVVNIVSHDGEAPLSSATEFVCRKVGIQAGVGLKGDLVTIADQ